MKSSAGNRSVDFWSAKAKAISLRVQNFVSGNERPVSGTRICKANPHDASELYSFAASQASDIEHAVASSREAFADGRWARSPTVTRTRCLHRLADLMDQNREELALLEVLDVGKPVSEALNFDVPAAAATIRHSADAADKLYGKVYGADHGSLSYELRKPVGVVGGLVGWNFPLLLAAAKIGPALAVGNCVILKPSELSPLSTARLATLACEAGLPAGVLNVVHGDRVAGEQLALHSDIDMITFTGSTRVGKQIQIAAGRSNMKRLLLECGGKAPHIVFEDCPDLDAVADTVLQRAFRNQGEVCVASSRLVVHVDVKDELLRRIVCRAKGMCLGNPLDPETHFGPLISQTHRNTVRSYVDVGRQEASLAFEADCALPSERGFYLRPVIFDGVAPKSRLAQEEIFGPVLSVLEFRSEEQALQIANDTIYGLSAIVWTKDLGRAQRMAYGIDAGWIVVYATENPRGGVDWGLSVGGHKQSGIGVEGGIDGLAAYTTQTAVQLFGG